MKICFLIFFFFLITSHFSFSQEKDSIPLPAVRMTCISVSQNGFYLIKNSGFEKGSENIPGLKIVKRFKNNFSIAYLTKNTDLKKNQDLILYEITDEWKLSTSLRKSKPKNSVLLSIKTIDEDLFRREFNLQVIDQYDDFLIIKATPTEFEQLLSSDFITYISELKFPEIEATVSQHDLSVNKINLVHDNFPEIKGATLTASIKERLFDTTDIDIKNRYHFIGLEDDNLDQHAGTIATLIIGAGNSSSRGKGVAKSATVTSSSFLQLLPDEDSYFIENNIFVQNHSYGTGIEPEYGIEAAAYDLQVNALPTLVHVFSAGNSGNQTAEGGPYQGIPGYGNLTGNLKMAKNIITVGAVNKFKEVVERSSKGPAIDGRIKPELVAYAAEGTSDAAALVSGTVLLLQDYFLQKNGLLPEAALVKAILIAGAEDVGNTHIDFASGYGNLDANKSMEIIQSGSYMKDYLSGNDLKKFTVTVPQGTDELKVALSWTDPPANPGDEFALVNDLNLHVEDPQEKNWQPWVLDASPNPESLQKIAERGRDSINNAELITIKDPSAGVYTINISATHSLQTDQNFAIAYTTVEENMFRWTFPTSSDALWERNNIMRWESTFENEDAKFEYRINEGTWILIEDNIALESGSFLWESLPETGKVQLRMTVGSQQFLSEKFAVAPEIKPEVAYNCQNKTFLTWSSVENATGYQVKSLGTYYMEEMAVVDDTSFVIDEEENQSKIWSVSPIFEEVIGFNGVAINIDQQGVACYYQNFFALLENDSVVNATLNLSTSVNIQKVVFRKENSGTITTIKEFTDSFNNLQFTITDENPEPGTNHYWASIMLADGTEISTNVVKIFISAEDTFEIFPNPIRAGETLSIISKGDDLDFYIFDMQGRMVEEDQLIQQSDRIDLKFYSPGIYIVQAVRKGEKVGAAKIIIR